MTQTAASSRANRLVELRDLVVLGVQEKITDRERLAKFAVSREIFVTEDSGTEYSYSSKYRYFDSLRFLHFDIADKIGQPIVWSPAALALSYTASITQFTNELSPDEKEIFRNQIFASKASQQFLASFCWNGEKEPPQSRDEFVCRGHPLYVLRTVRRSTAVSNERSSERVVEITHDPKSDIVSRKTEQEFLYTYRLWCLDADLIEEINIKEAERSGIPRGYSYVLYPLRKEVGLSTSDFLEALYAVLGQPTRAIVVPIPKLVYNLCVGLRIRVDTFKELLVETWSQNRELLHLERGPGVLIKGDIAATDKSYRDRYGNHRYYITIDGTVRTNLIVFPRGR
jgi:hypothetical protein